MIHSDDRIFLVFKVIGNVENNSNRIAVIRNEGKYFTIMRDCRNINVIYFFQVK